MPKKKSDQPKIAKSIPASETGSRVTCATKSGKKFLITNSPIEAKFTLWKISDEGYEKLSVSSNPLDFDEIIDFQS